MSTDESHFHDVRRQMSQIPGWVNWKTQLFPLLRSVCAGCMPPADWGWQSTIVVVFHSVLLRRRRLFPLDVLNWRMKRKGRKWILVYQAVMAQVFSSDQCASSTTTVVSRETGKWGHDVVRYTLKSRKACVGKKNISRRLGFKTVVSRGWITNAPLRKIAALPLWGQSHLQGSRLGFQLAVSC